MSQIEKLIAKFNTKPESVKFRELDKILKYIGCDSVEAKGSHKKYKHLKVKNDIVIPIHRGECKEFYKKQTQKQVKNILKEYEN